MLVLLFGVAALAVLVAATFDPNAYKPQLIRLVQEKKQRTLGLEGDIRIALWPSLAADFGRISLSEFKSDKEFAAVESARVSLALLPLLFRELVVREVTVRGLRADIVRFKDGRMNIDDLLVRDGQKQAPLKFGIGHVTVENASLDFRDEIRGTQYALSRVKLKTGRIANGVPSEVAFVFAVRGHQPEHDLTAELKTHLAFDLDQQVYALEGLDLEAKGRVADIDGLMAKATGNVTARLKSGEFSAGKLSVALTGARGKDHFDLRLDAPGFDFASGKASSAQVTVSASITRPQGAAALVLTLPDIAGTAQSFKADGAMALDFEMKQHGLTVKGRMASPVSVDFQARQAALPRLVASVSASGSRLPGKALDGEFAGSANIDAHKQGAWASLSGRIGDSNIEAKLGVTGFSPPAIGFDVGIDRLDVDRYLQPESAAASRRVGPSSDLARLLRLRASGMVRIGVLTVAGATASSVRLVFQAGGGRAKRL